MVDVIVSTGANMYHDLSEALGGYHYEGSPNIDDGELFEAGIDRIYDFVKNNTPISEITIVHSKVADQTSQLKQYLGEFIEEERISITELGVGLGVHGGPGVLLVAIRRSENN